MIVAIALSAALVATCTAIHYAVLRGASRMSRPREAPGRALAVAVAMISLAHVIEATVYAGGFWAGTFVFDIGSLKPSGQGDAGDMTFMDYFYFSLVNFTTLGRGDLIPQGHLRFMTAVEAFHGFLLITASGSYVLQIMSGKDPFGKG